MAGVKACCVLACVFALGACAAPAPPGPSVMAMPGQGKSSQEFQGDDVACRQYAGAAIGGVSPSQAANGSAVGSAVLGTLLGAGLGALIGSAGAAAGAGAAIGAGTGLLVGTAAGANAAHASYWGQQAHYDSAYAQCMGSRGEQVAAAPPPYPFRYPGPVYYGPPPPPYVYP